MDCQAFTSAGSSSLPISDLCKTFTPRILQLDSSSIHLIFTLSSLYSKRERIDPRNHPLQHRLPPLESPQLPPQCRSVDPAPPPTRKMTPQAHVSPPCPTKQGATGAPGQDMTSGLRGGADGIQGGGTKRLGKSNRRKWCYDSPSSTAPRRIVGALHILPLTTGGMRTRSYGRG